MVAALGGMLVPALLFTLLNSGSATSNGWGIPMATDIAFALAVLLMLGNKVPLSLKVFLTALAIVDDLGAVVVIALFYTEDLQTTYLLWAGLVWAGMLAFNYLGVRALSVYLALGVVLWYFTLQSGIHATIAGVLLAVAIPFRIRYSDDELVHMLEDQLGVIRRQVESKDIDPRCISEELEALHEKVRSPAQHLEQQLHQLVSFVIVPLFAFCNTSLVIQPEVLQHLVTPLGLGVLLGLVVGKPLGIMLFSYLAVRLGWAALPEGVRWSQLAGVGILGGIGFTMSIFVTLLAFEADLELQAIAKVAILLASLVAGLLGYGLLQRKTRLGPLDVPH
jgi:NhaA family Na+:H+ antiporter